MKDFLSLRHGIIGYERWDKHADDDVKDSLWVGDLFFFDKRRFAKDDETGAPFESE